MSWFSYLSDKQQFYPNYGERSDVKISSAARISYAVKIEYNGLLNEHLEVSVGALTGAYPTDFVIAFDSTFSIFGHSFDDYSFDRYSATYLGAYSSLAYIQKLSKHDLISLRLGINVVYFIPSFYGYSATSIWNTGSYKFFEASANMNPRGRPFLSPEVSIRYYHLFFKQYMPFISFNVVYSNNYPVNGNNYSIYGKNETLQGSFKRRFLHAGIEIGVKVSLSEQVIK